MLFDGLNSLGNIANKEWAFSSPNKTIILLSCDGLYFLRNIITLFYLLFHKILCTPVYEVSAFRAIASMGFMLIGVGAFYEYDIVFETLDTIAFVLLVRDIVLFIG